ncbi:MAG: M48 family metalloprotease [Bacteroidales bacterium]|jgi:predicted Zn-dependent protease|nr:M48 family metalloprotease [Bacteroidales bacterium]MDX9927786.1 M48 family metalloprotease [Bacteroidales bacterium]HNX84502.1 M48 family metalloprotease [Bacteroidales bacterium]HOC48948.1 M48 family metalloprotease [Bacteroidales bacterium]HPS98188.1 M48 family metalloprotease [Bacteroidales bacterium]
MKKRRTLIYAALITAALVTVISCAVNPVTGRKQIMLMSEAQEVQLGLSYDPQVLASFGEYNSPALQSWVQAKGTEMGKLSHRPNLEYHVKVVDSPVVNAFAVPGGYIYLTRGIMANLNNEAEFIGVLGHEMGHIAARHSVSQQTKQQLGTLLLIGGMIASPKFANYAEQAMQGLELLFLSFSREDEREADALGSEYATKMAYDGTKMADFYKVLIRMNLSEAEGGVPTFLSTHPDPGDRYNAVLRNTKAWQDSLKLPSYKVNGDSYLQMIDGMIYGEDPKQGYTMDNTFYHPELRFKFSYPLGWELTNAPTQVTVQPSDGRALMLFTLSNQKTLQSAVDTTMAMYGLQLQRSEKKTVNGLQAIVTLAKQPVQDQSTGATGANAVISYFVQYGSVIYVFHGVSTEADFASYAPTMEASMKTFAQLTDQSRINVKPKRVYVRKAPRAGTLASTLSALNMPQNLMEELSLLNNMELNETVPAGKYIKIIGE